MTAPDIHHSTREQREQFVADEFRCKACCDICGACQFLKGHAAEELYAAYIDGTEQFDDITLRLRYL